MLLGTRTGTSELICTECSKYGEKRREGSSRVCEAGPFPSERTPPGSLDWASCLFAPVGSTSALSPRGPSPLGTPPAVSQRGGRRGGAGSRTDTPACTDVL